MAGSYNELPIASDQEQAEIGKGPSTELFDRDTENSSNGRVLAADKDRFFDNTHVPPDENQSNNRFINFWENIQSTPRYSRVIEILNQNMFLDVPVQVCGVQLVESSAITKLFKFVFIAIAMIYITHESVRMESLDWEHDVNYFMKDFFVYDLHHVMLDTIIFFIIGRLHLDSRPGVDNLSYFLPMLCGIIYPSWSSTFGFLQHSVSMYEIMCRWPGALFEYVIGVVAIDAFLIFLHIKYSYRDGIILQKSIEVFLCLMVFVIPYATQSSFHLHHW